LAKRNTTFRIVCNDPLTLGLRSLRYIKALPRPRLKEPLRFKDFIDLLDSIFRDKELVCQHPYGREAWASERLFFSGEDLMAQRVGNGSDTPASPLYGSEAGAKIGRFFSLF
jgi:hypothetical protein